MHICKLFRRKIARQCFFQAGVPAYARIRAGATALKSNSASYNFSAEWGPRQNLHMQCFGGEKRRPQGPRKLAPWGARQASLLCRRAASVATALPHAQPGISALQLRWVEKPIDFWLRKEVAAGSVATTQIQGRAEGTKKKIEKCKYFRKMQKKERLDSKNDRNICIFQKLFVSLQMKFASRVHTTLQHYT